MHLFTHSVEITQFYYTATFTVFLQNFREINLFSSINSVNCFHEIFLCDSKFTYVFPHIL